jgi:pimeloyl-ACP methyl ester carboxylesterase
MDRLAARGFESHAVTHSPDEFSTLGTVDEEIEALAKIASKRTPAIIVGHGLSAFVAQKYLESYAAAGLVLISPFPPEPSSLIARATTVGELKNAFSGQQTVEPDPRRLFEDASLIENTLNLEPLAAFMNVLLVVNSNDPVVMAGDVEELCRFHDLGTLCVENRGPSVQGIGLIQFAGPKNHLTMADPAWEEISGQIVDWIDDNY